MRFSLKWLLLCTAYVALVAGAFVSRNDLLAGALGSRSSFLADAVWAVTLCAICYAIVVACFGIAERRPAALGFALLATAGSATGSVDARHIWLLRLVRRPYRRLGNESRKLADQDVTAGT
jgi:hypothetical protein